MQRDPLVTILPTRFIEGWGGPPENAQLLDTVPLLDAVGATYETDAHLAMYFATEDDRVEGQTPRLLKRALPKIREMGGDVLLNLLLIDVDCEEAHRTKEPAPEAWREETYESFLKLPDEILEGMGWWDSRGGTRLAWTLEEALRPEEWETLFWSLLTELKKHGVVGDVFAKDWTRLHRLPLIKRDGIDERRDVVLDALGPLRWRPKATSVFSGIEQARTPLVLGKEIPEGQRDTVLYKMGCKLRNAGLQMDEITAALNAINEGRCKPPLPESQVAVKARQACQYPAGTETLSPPPKQKERPLVANFRPGMDSRMGIPLEEIRESVLQRGDYVFPAALSGVLLFAGTPAPEGKLGDASCIRSLNTEAALSAWIRDGAVLRWTSREVQDPRDKTGSVCKPAGMNELSEVLKARPAMAYDAVETHPHYPMRPRTWYACGVPKGANGTALGELIALLNPATELDRQLLLALFLTPGWGGEPGRRPAFVLTSDHGPGSGKTQTAELVAKVWGGSIALMEKEDWGKFTERLLTETTLDKRVVILDNLRSRVASAQIESVITAPKIDGKKLYVGNCTRLNTLTWILTANAAELSRDLADRSYPIKMGPPRRGSNFERQVQLLLSEKREQIVGDLIEYLQRRPSGVVPEGARDRFSAWQEEVLAKCGDTVALSQLVRERRKDVDGDAAEQLEVAEVLIGELKARGHDPGIHTVFVSHQEAFRLFAELMESRTPRAVSTRLGLHAGGGKLEPLRRWRMADAKGWLWVPEGVEVSEGEVRRLGPRTSRTVLSVA